MDSVAAIGMGMQGSLEDQLNKLKQFESGVVQYRPHMDELEKCHQVRIFDKTLYEILVINILF